MTVRWQGGGGRKSSIPAMNLDTLRGRRNGDTQYKSYQWRVQVINDVSKKLRWFRVWSPFCMKSILMSFEDYHFYKCSYFSFVLFLGSLFSLRSLAWKGYPSTLRFIATQGASDLITTTLSSRPYCTDCTPTQVTGMATGFISANMNFWRSDGDTRLTCSETMTSASFKSEWFRRQGAKDFGDLGMKPEGFRLALEGATSL